MALSFCVTTYNRFNLTIQSFEKILDDERVSEIVISDDCSTDGSYEKLVDFFKGNEKVKIFRNERNVDCYVNKRIAIELATNKWRILGDSDNVFTKDYLDKIFSYEWDEKTALMPSFAYPNFCYEQFSGLTIDKHNVAQYFDEPLFETCCNCANYFVNRDFYLKVWDGSVNPHTADSLYQNYNWLVNDGKIFIVPELQYYHSVHPESHYILNNHKTGSFHEELKQKYRELI